MQVADLLPWLQLLLLPILGLVLKIEGRLSRLEAKEPDVCRRLDRLEDRADRADSSFPSGARA